MQRCAGDVFRRLIAVGSVLVVLFYGAVPGLAQDDTGGQTVSSENQVREIEPDQLRIGNRARIVLQNGSEFEGRVMGLRKDQVRLNLSFENLSLSGNVTLQKDEIETVFVLPSLTMKTREEILEAKERVMASRAASGASDEAVAKTSDGKEENEKEGATDEKPVSEMKLTAEHRRLLDRFPADSWGPERYRSVESKYPYQRTTREREFLTIWEKLTEARNIQQLNHYRELLDKFPPDEGWSKKKYETLTTEKGLLPGKGREVRTPRERAFIDAYETWKEGVKWKKKMEQKKEKQKEEQERTENETGTTSGSEADADAETSGESEGGGGTTSG